MFCWEPKGGYCCTMSMMIAPFWFSTKTSLNSDSALLDLNWRYDRLTLQLLHGGLVIWMRLQVTAHQILYKIMSESLLPKFFTIDITSCFFVKADATELIVVASNTTLPKLGKQQFWHLPLIKEYKRQTCHTRACDLHLMMISDLWFLTQIVDQN